MSYDLKNKDRVMVMLGPDHPMRGTVVSVKGEKITVKLDDWGGGVQTKVYDRIDLLKLDN